MNKYELIIIGAGPSGYAAAMRAMDFRKKTLLIEKEHLGGAGITNGALSSKTWWDLSRIVRSWNSGFRSFGHEPPPIQFEELAERVDTATRKRMEILHEHLAGLSSPDNGDLLEYRTGRAKLVSNNEVSITYQGNEEVVYGENIILATGSRPRKLPDIPIDEKVILTSDGIDKLTDFPESMVILGAGVIGCEFATIFSGFGRTKVYLIDKGDRILPAEDEDIVNVIELNMEENGVTIHRNSRLIRMDIVDGKVEYELEYTDGKKEIFHVEKALISVGRVPNYEDLWEPGVNIELNARGITDEDTQTSQPNIYAVGDITADIALVNVGELEGRHAVEKIFSVPERKLIYENISTIMFLHPEVAGVGLNEIQAREKGIDFQVACLDYVVIPRAMAERNTQGLIKLLVTDDEEMKILGMRIVGNHASSAIQAVALLIWMDKGIRELAECVHPHPSITEGIQECVRMLLGKSMFKPRALKGILQGKMSCRRCIGGKYLEIEH